MLYAKIYPCQVYRDSQCPRCIQMPSLHCVRDLKALHRGGPRPNLQVTYTALILDSGFRRNDGKWESPAFIVTPDLIRGPVFMKPPFQGIVHQPRVGQPRAGLPWVHKKIRSTPTGLGQSGCPCSGPFPVAESGRNPVGVGEGDMALVPG
jgi:hypothetical protein